MGKQETRISKLIELAFNPFGRLFRNQRGVAEYTDRSGTKRKYKYGVGPNGFPDEIGWRSVKITAEMIGTTIAQFAGVEVKKPGEIPTEEQFKRLEQINSAGGFAIWADSPESALQKIKSPGG